MARQAAILLLLFAVVGLAVTKVEVLAADAPAPVSGPTSDDGVIAAGPPNDDIGNTGDLSPTSSEGSASSPTGGAVAAPVGGPVSDAVFPPSPDTAEAPGPSASGANALKAFGVAAALAAAGAVGFFSF
ncbi:classical arabinogalactan protein 10 [Quercus suber]|uniref:classical arabinogalactan protein 10 n=1 Tax=Quercus suber TaxID=58331 RepID=UPI000CE1AD10|nr:classical arabinogalactan protein 10-like [Quercus suber]POE45697.1 hypothetical protein CFP56_05586 [Quercus suber]